MLIRGLSYLVQDSTASGTVYNGEADHDRDADHFVSDCFSSLSPAIEPLNNNNTSNNNLE